MAPKCTQCGGTGPECPAQGRRVRREVLTPADQAMTQIQVAWVLWECLPWYTRLWRRLTGRAPF
jgi:hypothetical protein